MYQAHVPDEARQWPHRRQLIRDRILLADADIVCIQEAAGDTFDSDFHFMLEQGYEAVLHKKFRFRCATFHRPQAFTLQSVAHEDRALVTSFLRTSSSSSNASSTGATDGDSTRPLYVANVHLSGGASPDRRLRQVHGVTERVRKWAAAAAAKPALKGRRGSAARRAQEANLAARDAQEASPPPPPCVIICGDFNSDGNTAVRRLLVEGSVEPGWREPQYADVVLTSKPRRHGFGAFADAGEVAYGQNVCDGDWGDWGARTNYERYRARRPATYVVPSLASVFLERSPTSTNRQQVVADNEMLSRLLQHQDSAPPPVRQALSAEDRAVIDATAGADAAFVEACRRAFDAIDADRGGSLSATELREALQRLSVRGAGGQEASEADADAMLSAADADSDGEVDFGDGLGSDFGETLSGGEDDVAPEKVVSEGAALSWLELVNRELGRGGTYRGVMSALEASEAACGRRELTRRAWHGVFARELGEGKWWQVAYDLDKSNVPVGDFEMDADVLAYGASGGEVGRKPPRRHYEGWLDYVYYARESGLRLVGYQESLDEEQARRIYQDGDALPNEWHASDHLPVGCVFEWVA